MATPGDVLATRLLTDPALQALVGDRIGPSMPEQDPAGDYLIFYRVGGGDAKNLGGAAKLQPYMMRVEAFAETESRAEAILFAVRDRLNGWKDKSIGVHGCFATADADEQVAGPTRQVSGETFQLWFKAP